jgi:hypothetical protein
MRRTAWRLDELQPEWLNLGSGWGHGVKFRCPEFGHDHYLLLCFWNPCDGSQAVWVGTAYTRSGTSFSTLTLQERVELGGCFLGMLTHGTFYPDLSGKH